MSCCCIETCKNSQKRKIKGIAFHRFPVDENRKCAWIKAVGRENWFPSNSTRICSIHFKDSDFVDKSALRLKKDAIPINHSQHLKDSLKGKTSGVENTNLNFEMVGTAVNLTHDVDDSSEMVGTAVNLTHDVDDSSEMVGTAVNLTHDVDNSSEMESRNLNSKIVKTAVNLKCDMDKSSIIDLNQQTSAVIENVNLRRRMKKASDLKDRYQKKISSLNAVFKRQEKKIQDLRSLIQCLKKNKRSKQLTVNCRSSV